MQETRRQPEHMPQDKRTSIRPIIEFVECCRRQKRKEEPHTE